MTLNCGQRLVVPLFVAILFSVAATVPATRKQKFQNNAPRLPQSDWKRYTIKGEEFSVLLPMMPAMTTQTVHLIAMNKDRQQRVLGASENAVVYAIYSFENRKPRQSLNELIAEFHDQFSEIEIRQPLNVGGFLGKEFSFQSGDRKGKSQFYITERHIYVFRVVGSTLGDVDEGMPRFLSSIKLEKKPEGLQVVDGSGEQPNSDPSILNTSGDEHPLSGKDTTIKATVITKPEPDYTDEARRNQVTGTVILRCVFRSTGAVTNLRAMSGLPFGLTENAIAAARQIRFIPAVKNGRFVSMYIQLEYNFNLY